MNKIYVWFGLVWFYGTSTIITYLMPNPFLYIYLNDLFEIELFISIVFCLHTVKCQKQFYPKQFSSAKVQFQCKKQTKKKQFHFLQFSLA